MSRRSGLSAFPTIRMPSPISGERRKSSPPFGGRRQEWGRAGSVEVLVVDRESEVAGVGREKARRSSCFCRGRNKPTPRTRPEIPRTTVFHGGLISLAFLEASRREESGDTAGAWVCYRAVLRTITHLRRRGSTLQRQPARGRAACCATAHRLGDGAEDHDLPTSHGVEVVLENEPKPEWDLFAVKYGYLELMGALERPIPLSALQGIEGEWTFRLGDLSLSPEMVGQLVAADGSSCASPNAAGAVLRLLCANYLAHAETRGHSRGNRPSWRR